MPGSPPSGASPRRSGNSAIGDSIFRGMGRTERTTGRDPILWPADRVALCGLNGGFTKRMDGSSSPYLDFSRRRPGACVDRVYVCGRPAVITRNGRKIMRLRDNKNGLVSTGEDPGVIREAFWSELWSSVHSLAGWKAAFSIRPNRLGSDPARSTLHV